MAATVEATHRRIIDKLTKLTNVATQVNQIAKSIGANIHIDTAGCKKISDSYNLSVVEILIAYYTTQRAVSRNYYIALSSECILPRIQDLYDDAYAACAQLDALLDFDARVDRIHEDLSAIAACTISIPVEKHDYETCYCGERMIPMPGISQFHCDACDAYRHVDGAIFGEYPQAQDGQKQTKLGYDPNRHHKTWIEQIQAIPNKDFTARELEKINRVLDERGIIRSTLTCEYMREILKLIRMTRHNDFVPLLVKLMGGPTPPTLSFDDNKIEAARFARIIELYCIVNPDKNNKPYYPFFIYKIYEHMFHDEPEKKQILSFIHLQSYDTVIKHDKIFRKICELSNPDDELVYTPTIVDSP